MYIIRDEECATDEWKPWASPYTSGTRAHLTGGEQGK